MKYVMGGGNSLNTIRLLACLEVMIGHMQAHLGLYLPRSVNFCFDIFMGVPIFFLLSGYLIFISLAKQREWKTYFNKRILRLYPELWICLFFEILSILVFYKAQVPAGDLLKFSFTQGTVFQFWTPDSLRGYGCGTPNGSLWTITVIVQFYILIYIFYNWFKKQKMAVWLAIILTSIAYSVAFVPAVQKHIPEIASKLMNQTIFNYLWLFLLGSFVARFSGKLLCILSKYWYISFAVLVALMLIKIDVYAGLYPVIRSIFLGAFVIGVAYRFPKINIKKDISYGVYIYHMIFVNIAIQLGLAKNWYAFIAVALITFIFAYISYSTAGAIYRKKKQKLSIAR